MAPDSRPAWPTGTRIEMHAFGMAEATEPGTEFLDPRFP